MRTKLHLLTMALLIICASSASATVDPEALIADGNKSYNEAQFESALEKYLAAKQTGIVSPHLEYNIGNSLYRLGRLGEALAAFRRAQLDLPRDADLTHNQSLTTEKLALGDDSPETGTLHTVLGLPSSILSRYELQIVALSSYVIFWSILAWNKVRGRRRVWALPSFFLLVGCFAALLGWFGSQIPGGTTVPSFLVAGERLAVAKSNNTKAFSGDSETFQVISVLRQGTEIMTGELRPEWTEVYFTDGRRGWVKRSEVDFVGEIE